MKKILTSNWSEKKEYNFSLWQVVHQSIKELYILDKKG